MNTRRKFIKESALGLSTIALSQLPFAEAKAQIRKKKEDGFKLGIAGYSFYHFNLEDSLAMMKRMDVHYLCIKDFHLPYESSTTEIKDFHQKLANAGVTGYAVGPVYTRKRKDIDKIFDYAKRVGVNLIVGIPNKEDLGYLENKVKEYNIRFAIHNHGPEDKLYPNATVIYNAIRDLDKRIGICFDMGHDTRDGQDAIKDLKKYHSRIFDMHFKNVTSATKEGTTCELGRGVIDIPAYMTMLRMVKYKGVCSLEFEKDMKDPLAGLAESVGYFRGVQDC